MSGWLETWANQHPKLSRLGASGLCRRDVAPTGIWQVIGWWEARRIPYNLIVGAAGILSSLVFVIVGLGSYFFFHGEFPVPEGLTPIAVILYAAIANLCFTGGWLAELLIRKAWPEEADRFATMTFSVGLVFSVLLTLIPAITVGVVGIFGLLAHLFGVVNKHAG